MGQVPMPMIPVHSRPRPKDGEETMSLSGITDLHPRKLDRIDALCATFAPQSTYESELERSESLRLRIERALSETRHIFECRDKGEAPPPPRTQATEFNNMVEGAQTMIQQLQERAN